MHTPAPAPPLNRSEADGRYVGTVTIDLTGTGWLNGTVSYVGGASNDIVITGLIPEPSSFASLLAGLGSLLGLQRFRRRR